MKYLLYRIKETGEWVPIIFPSIISHSEIDIAFFEKTHELISAGYIDIEGIYCYGKSNSLNILSRGVEDSKIIEGIQ